jgi:hypothetical protein
MSIHNASRTGQASYADDFGVANLVAEFPGLLHSTSYTQQEP